METISRIILQGIDNTGPASKSAKANMASLADQTTVSAKQAAAAMRMVPAQMTDIVTQLAGGQSPLLVLIQQGGQLKDMFGGTGNAAKAMGNYLLGLASPATIAAAGLAAVGAAAYVGSKESFEFNKQLALTGGYAGLSASQLMAMSARLSEANGTQHETASVLAAIVATGQVAAGQFEVIGSAAMAMSDATGRSVKEIVAEFIELGKEPAAASAKLNEQYHYLTLSTYEQIKALEEQGKKTEAAALAQRTYAGAMKTAADQVLGQLGLLERGWKSLTDGAKKAWDAMLNVGRGQTTGEQLAALEKSLADREQRGPLNSTSTASFEKGNAALRQKIEEQREALRMENRAANSRGDNARIQAEGIAAQQEVSKLEDQAKGLTLVNKKLDEYHQRLDAIRKADPNSASLDPATIKRMEAQIRKSGMGGAPKGNENAINTDLVDLKGDMQQVERAVKASIEAIKTDYDVGLLGTREYVDKEFAIRQDGLQKQLAIARDLEEVASGKKNTVAAQRYQNEIEKIQDEISAGTAKHANDVTRYDANVKRATSEYLASLTAEYNVRQQAISDIIAGASLGAVAQEQLQRMTNLTREFNKRKEELRKASEKPEANGGISRETYDKELADLQSYYDRRVAQEKDFNAKDRANRSDPNVGAAKAFNDYKEQAADVAGQTQRQWAGLYSNLEDAAVGWATRSKVSIASVGQAFYAELVRMQIRAAASSVYTAISGGLGLAGLFGGGSSIAAAGASDTSSIYSLASGASGLGLKFKANAKGDIYSTGGLHEYVNSIVSRPTIFPFAKGGALGLMGEAGPEAIMPLSRGPDGSLGVKTVAGSGSQQPFVYAPVAHIAVDARADRAAVIGDVQQLLAQNNKQQLENLKRLGVIPA